MARVCMIAYLAMMMVSQLTGMIMFLTGAHQHNAQAEGIIVAKTLCLVGFEGVLVLYLLYFVRFSRRHNHVYVPVSYEHACV